MDSEDNKIKDILDNNPELADRTDFASRYDIYRKADAEKAWNIFEKRYIDSTKHGFASLAWLRYAAVLVVIISATVFFLFHLTSPQPVEKIAIGNVTIPSSLDKDTTIKSVITRAQEAGKVNATIIPLTEDERKEVALQTGLSADELLEANRLTTIHNHEYWLTLSDGTMVHINGGTRLIYPEHFIGSNRDVYIEGEAYFMVTKDASHPFIVHTPHGDVREIGTEFNVSTRADKGSCTEVVLISGSIAVKSGKGNNEHIIKPGEKATISTASDNNGINVTQVDTEPYIAWNTGRFIFHERTLESIMLTMAKWYDLDVIFENEAARRMLFSGNFDRYDSHQPIIRAISNVTGLDIEVSNSRIVIK